MALWTKKELVEAQRLAEAAEASGAHWALADWLLLKEPLTRGGRGLDVDARLMELAQEIGYTVNTLRALRTVARAWPVEFRAPSIASFAVHREYTAGGARGAAGRREILEEVPRNRAGKVTVAALHAYRGSRTGAVRTPITSVSITRVLRNRIAAMADDEDRAIGALVAELLHEALEAREWLAADDTEPLAVAA